MAKIVQFNSSAVFESSWYNKRTLNRAAFLVSLQVSWASLIPIKRTFFRYSSRRQAADFVLIASMHYITVVYIAFSCLPLPKQRCIFLSFIFSRSFVFFI